MKQDPHGKPQDTIIKWDDKYAIGIPSIDEQHKHFVELCNNFYMAVLDADLSDEGRRQVVKDTLLQCTEYVLKHFSEEERLMKACNFSDFAAHKAEHNDFTRKVLDRVQYFDRETPSSSLELAKFFYDWVTYHIAHTDKLYVRTLADYLAHHRNA